MSKRFLIATLSFSLLLLSLSSCLVSKKKFDDVNGKKSILEVEKAEAVEELAVVKAENSRMVGQLDDYKVDVESLSKDTAQLGRLYRDLIGDYQDLSQVSAADAKNLSGQMQKVGTLMKELAEKDNALEKDKAKINRLQTDLVAREVRVKELEDVLAEKDAAVKDLKKSISGALLGFTAEDLTVEQKNGKVYVSMSNQLMFKSGSYSVDQKGVDALSKLANVLKEQSDLDIVVEGHTDNVPLRGGGTIKDNWDLSVLRATSIVRILTDNGLQPLSVSASGRGEHMPKVDNDTPENRAINRRTEIIIQPNLDELFKMLDN